MIRLALSLALCIPALAQEPRPEDSARKFAHGFYSWYVPIAAKGTKGPAFEIAITQKPSLFSPQLLQALRDDAAAQAKVSDDIVGLDFDPFLSSQDPSNQFVLGQTIRKEDGYWVYFYNSKASQQRGKPDVIAVAAQSGGRWFFTNFRFPDGGDLVKTLKALKLERERPPHSSAAKPLLQSGPNLALKPPCSNHSTLDGAGSPCCQTSN